VVATRQGLDPFRPTRCHLLPQTLDDPHRTEQPAWIGLASLEHEKRMQRLRAGDPGLGTDGVQITSHGEVVLLHYLIVAMLRMRMTQNDGRDMRVVAIEARCASADPA